jgi:hypothetical protein
MFSGFGFSKMGGNFLLLSHIFVYVEENYFRR